MDKMGEKKEGQEEKTGKGKRKRRMRLTIITTKFGDKGNTYLAGGFVVGKNHPRVRAYGDVDELASFTGYAISIMKEKGEKFKDIVEILERIQNHLFILGGDLARILRPSESIKEEEKRVTKKMIDWLEAQQKRYLSELEPLEDFILPGGCPHASMLHILRTVARRCEREIVELASKEKINENCIVYINRLSDLFFVLARIINKREGVNEKIVDWKQ